MDLMTKVVHDSLEVAQMKQKTWYDRNARDRTLQEGDMVLHGTVADVFPQVVSSMAGALQGGKEGREGAQQKQIDACHSKSIIGTPCT